MITNKTIEQRIYELENRVTKLEIPSLKNVSFLTTKTKKLSAKEFLITKEAMTETKKVLALGYFLEHIEGMESFNTTDLETVFRSAKERPPKNINDAVNKNINPGGFIMEAAEKKDNKKAWTLTSTGEKHVEEELKKSN